jgi:AcrR family transcriptional regulator
MPDQAMRYRQRSERILGAAAELVLRWGYKRVTIEDIAKQAGIGKGTVYLHWRTREALFIAMLARESLEVIDDLLDATRRDPIEILPHRQVGRVFLGVMRRPLLRAMFGRDIEILGALAHEKSIAAVRDQKFDVVTELAALLRAHGLMRTDLDADAQVYALNAVTTGFYLVQPLMSGLPEPDLEARARAIAQTVRNAFEPPGSADREVLRTLAPKAIALYEQLREAYRERVQGDLPREELS